MHWIEDGITVLLSTPCIVFLRATVDVVVDTVAMLSAPELPPPIIGVLFHLLRDSRELCLTYIMDANLQSHSLGIPAAPFFKRGGLASDSLREKWTETCRHYAESIMRSRRDDLGMEAAAELAQKFVEELLWYR
jgi:hypothetical protein